MRRYLLAPPARAGVLPQGPKFRLRMNISRSRSSPRTHQQLRLRMHKCREQRWCRYLQTWYTSPISCESALMRGPTASCVQLLLHGLVLDLSTSSSLVLLWDAILRHEPPYPLRCGDVHCGLRYAQDPGQVTLLLGQVLRRKSRLYRMPR